MYLVSALLSEQGCDSLPASLCLYAVTEQGFGNCVDAIASSAWKILCGSVDRASGGVQEVNDRSR